MVVDVRRRVHSDAPHECVLTYATNEFRAEAESYADLLIAVPDAWTGSARKNRRHDFQRVEHSWRVRVNETGSFR